MSGRAIRIHYRRLPDRERVFEQRWLAETDEAVVTLLEETPLPKPVRVGGQVVLDAGAPVVWFTFPGRWHDIGRFHLRDGSFTGIYANILTPVRMEGDRWETVDLFLDVWCGVDGRLEILDEEELAEAAMRGWVDAATVDRARAEANSLMEEAKAGSWPPELVKQWTLDRARIALRGPTD